MDAWIILLANSPWWIIGGVVLVFLICTRTLCATIATAFGVMALVIMLVLKTKPRGHRNGN